MLKKVSLALFVLLIVIDNVSCKKSESSKEKAEREKTYLEKTVDSYLESNRKLKEAEKNLERQKKDYREAEEGTSSTTEEKEN